MTLINTQELEIKFPFGKHKNAYALSSDKKRNIEIIIKSFNTLLKENKHNFIKITNEILFLKKNYRKIFKYSNINEKKKIYIIKKNINNKNFKHNTTGIFYKISHSTENIVTEDKLHIYAPYLLKFKTRLRIMFKNLPLKNWFLDLTLVKYLKVEKNINPTEINGLKKLLFYFDEMNNFLDIDLFLKFDAIEIELEYYSNNKKDIIKVKDLDIKNVSDYFIKYFISINKNANFIKNKIIKKISYLLKKRGAINLRSVINKAVELTTKSYTEIVLPDIKNYLVTEKLDGERCILYYNDEEKYLLLNKKILKFEKELPINSAIIDGEYYNEKLYAFDIIELDGKNISDLKFSERYKLLSDKFLGNENINIKIFIELNENNYCTIFKNTYENAKREIDGLILTSKDNNYKYTKNYKWKPVKYMTIDFLVKECPSLVMGDHPYRLEKKNNKLYLLFSAINDKDHKILMSKHIKYYNKIFIVKNNYYYPIIFSPPDNVNAHVFEYEGKENLDNKICEFNYDVNKKTWKLIKIRNDQTPNLKEGIDIGNNYFVALDIWNNYKNPLNYDILCKSISELENENYFVKDNEAYRQSRNYNRYVISNVINNIKNLETVFDMGVGRGADIFKFNKKGTRKLLGLDIDIDALSELIGRYKNAIKNKKSNFNTMMLRIKQMDLNDDYEKNINELIMTGLINENEKFNLIFSDFAFHYFTGNKKSIENIMNFIKYFCKKGTEVIFSCFDGMKIFNLFKNKDDAQYFIKEKNITKIIITRKFDNKKLLEYGQMIGVTHPFSGGKSYDEPLINIKYIKKIFKNNGFNHVYTKNFIDFYQNYDKKNMLTDSDKEYCSLYIVNKFIKK